MCGRFRLTFFPDAEDLFEQLFGIPFPQFVDPAILEDDILPFRDISTIHADRDGHLVCRSMFWNLIPRSSTRFESGRTWFNTRQEKFDTSLQKTLLRTHRCIVPVNSFLETRKRDGKAVYHSCKVAGKTVRKKETHEFRLLDQPIMALGGIYDVWGTETQETRYSCSIITQKPNAMIAEVHDRMPFILAKDQIEIWLDRTVDDAELLSQLITPYPPEKMARRRVWPHHDQETQLHLFN
ncbi:MAG: SOS response-associated peptidase [bacterium]